MLNFTVGPVQSCDKVREIGSEQVPYFRTPEFSSVMLESEKLLLEFLNCDKDSKVAFITGSGTASMEAVVVNTLSKKDKALVINGGSFGQRFVDLLTIYSIPHTAINLEQGMTLTASDLSKYENCGYTAFLVNIHETSTGVRYDLDLISEFCKKNKIFLIVDAISSFIADEIDMKKNNLGVLITGSQKALACPPGISIIVLSKEGVERVYRSNPKCMYLNLQSALKNQERGQTPFTPAVGILLQINVRLKEIKENGGIAKETEKIASLAKYFREKIKDLPFEIISESMSNAVTPLHPTTASAFDIFSILKDEYGIWVCPNGGEMRDSVFRVGHIGALTFDDYDRLIDAFKDLQKRKII